MAKTLAGKALSKAKKAAKKAAKWAGERFNDVPFAPLLPFLPAMKIILAKKGHKKTGDLSETTKKFYSVVIKGSNFEADNFIGVSSDEMFSSFDPVSITAIVSAVLNFMKATKKKKPEDRTPEEKAAVAAMDKSAENIVKAGMVGTGAAKAANANFLSDNAIWILAAVVLFVLIVK